MYRLERERKGKGKGKGKKLGGDLALVFLDVGVEPGGKGDDDVTRHEQYTFEPIFKLLADSSTSENEV
jgi:hypothetical protein